MINKNMRNIFSAVIMMLLMLLTVVSTTIVGAIIYGNNVITFKDLAKESEKENNISNAGPFRVDLGLMIADGVIYKFESDYHHYMFWCSPVEKVTLIAFGSYYPFSDSLNNFYITTFTNVSLIIGTTSRKLHVSEEYQHFITFSVPYVNTCIIYLMAN